MTAAAQPGQVITFYSYKGGVGRTLALSNVACLLARRQADDREVLMIDWDLEAPGLHRFFHERLTRALTRAQSPTDTLDLHPGLIDLFVELEQATRSPELAQTEQSEETAHALLDQIDLDRFILPTDVPSLSLLKAGCFDDHYAARVSTFPWEAVYTRSPALIRVLAERLAERYSYVLIDSRTGITDTSGICTMLMPEKLVVVFTPNRQSLLGVEELTRRALAYRKQSEDLRRLIVFPLPSRIEAAEPTLRERWRTEAGLGYEPLFEQLFTQQYSLTACDLGTYFNEVQIQHVPRYAYGEEIAVLVEPRGDRLSMTHSFETFTDWLVERPVPWAQSQTVEVPAAFEEHPKLAEAVFARLSPEEQIAAQRLFTRLVRVAGPDATMDTGLQVPLSDLHPSLLPLVRSVAKDKLVVVDVSKTSGKEVVQIAHQDLIMSWRRLRKWIDDDREFLLWRQQLRANLADWEKTQRDPGALLSGAPLAVAQAWQSKRGEDLNDAEQFYIAASIEANVQAQRRQQSLQKERRLTVIGVALGIVVVGYFAWQMWRADQEARRVEEAAQRSAQAAAATSEANDYAGQGELEKALASYSRALALDPSAAETYVRRGMAYEQKGEFAQASKDYSQAIELKPADVDAYRHRGSSFARQGDYQNALADYNHLIELNPTDPAHYVGRGLVQEDKGLLDEAITDYSSALTLQPEDASAFFFRGQAYQKKGEKEKAIADLQKTLGLNVDPQTAQAAQARLAQLGVRPAQPRPPTAPTVYLHYTDKADKPMLDSLAKMLAGKGFDVQRTEFIARTTVTNGEVRYFSQADEAQGAAIRALVESGLAQQGVKSSLDLRYLDAKKFPDAKPGQLEVWLPPLSRRLPSSNVYLK